MKAALSRDDLRRLCEKDLATGHDRMLTTREVSRLEDWAYSTIKRWVYDKPPILESVKVANGKLKIARIRIPYSETLKVFHPQGWKGIKAT
jgi:hypothetical protein